MQALYTLIVALVCILVFALVVLVALLIYFHNKRGVEPAERKWTDPGYHDKIP